jgi:hypothetical protein
VIPDNSTLPNDWTTPLSTLELCYSTAPHLTPLLPLVPSLLLVPSSSTIFSTTQVSTSTLMTAISPILVADRQHNQGVSYTLCK